MVIKANLVIYSTQLLKKKTLKTLFVKMPKRRMQTLMDESDSGLPWQYNSHTMPHPDLPHKFLSRHPHASNRFTHLAARHYTLEQQLRHKVKKGPVSLLS